MLPGEARVRAVLVGGGRAHRERPGERARSVTVAITSSSPAATASTIVPGEREAVGTGSPARTASPSPTAFEPKTRGVGHLPEREDAAHVRTVTSPAVPSTRTRAPSAISSVP